MEGNQLADELQVDADAGFRSVLVPGAVRRWRWGSWGSGTKSNEQNRNILFFSMRSAGLDVRSDLTIFTFQPYHLALNTKTSAHWHHLSLVQHILHSLPPPCAGSPNPTRPQQDGDPPTSNPNLSLPLLFPYISKHAHSFLFAPPLLRRRPPLSRFRYNSAPPIFTTRPLSRLKRFACQRIYHVDWYITGS